MGFMRHDAIIVTGWSDEHLDQAHAKAIALGMQVSNIVDGVTNGERSFLIAPDGSKEGWAESSQGDERRARFIEWMRSLNHFYPDWVAVSFGGDSSHARITDHDGHIPSECDDHDCSLCEEGTQ